MRRCSHDLLPPERRDLASRAWPALERAHPGLPGPTLELAADLAEAAGEPRSAAAPSRGERSPRAATTAPSPPPRRPPGGPSGWPPVIRRRRFDADEVLVARARWRRASRARRWPLGQRPRGPPRRGGGAGRPPGRPARSSPRRAALAAGDLAPAPPVDAAAAREAAGDAVDPALAAPARRGRRGGRPRPGRPRARRSGSPRGGRRRRGHRPARRSSARRCSWAGTSSARRAGDGGRPALVRAGGRWSPPPPGWPSWHLRAQQELALDRVDDGRHRAPVRASATWRPGTAPSSPSRRWT